MVALYSMGLSVDEIKNIIEKKYKILATIEKKPIARLIGSFITHKNSNVEGLINGEKLEKLVDDIAKEKNMNKISDTKIPLATVTCDTITMKECICCSNKIESNNEIDYINDISVGKAVRASMSFPGIYTTCNYKEYNFIDGGTKNNLPVEVLKKMGADKIISVSFDLDEYKPTNNLFDVVIRALDIFSLDNVVKGRNISNVSCIVKTEDTTLLGISDYNAVIKAGYDAVMEHKEEILKLLKNS